MSEIPKDGTPIFVFLKEQQPNQIRQCRQIFWDGEWYDTFNGAPIELKKIDRWLDVNGKWHKVKDGNP